MGIEEAGFPPTTVKPVPEIVDCEMLTVAVPVFVRLSAWVEFPPTATLPKVRLAEDGERIPVPDVCELAGLVV